MNLLVGMKKVTIHLPAGSLNGRRNIQKRKTLGLRVSFLNGKFGKVQGTDINSGRRARLHASCRNAVRSQLPGNSIRRFLSDTPAFKGVLADEHLPVKEGTSGQNKRPTMKNCPGSCLDARNFLILKEKIFGKIGVNTYVRAT